MTELFGKQFSRDELLERVGDVSQIAGIKLVELADGREKGVRAAEFTTGTGLCFTALIDRGLDISSATYNGKSLCWRSSTGDVSPAFFDARGLEWLRSFFGGLVCTCGLTYCGAPGMDGDEELGLHGRVSNSPAQNVAVDMHWEGDDYVMSLTGEVRETGVFRDSLIMTRQIGAKMGGNVIALRDVVENRSYEPAPHMMLYHINIGFPVVDVGAKLVSPTTEVTPRDGVSAGGKENFNAFVVPAVGYEEKVYYHDLKADRSGMTMAGIVNPRVGGTGLGVYVKYSKKQLPFLAEWKQMGQGTYVVGVEPANCHVQGRVLERGQGTLVTLAPGETATYDLEIGVLEDKKAIKEFEGAVAKLMGSTKVKFADNKYGATEDE